MNPIKVSWRTTIGGIVLFLSLVTSQLNYAFDDDQTTNPDWSIILAAVAGLWTGLVARDNCVTSEQAGAK